jgi:VanZ family protein
MWVNMLIVAFKKQGTNRYLKTNARIVALFFALAYGGLLEYYQSKWFIDRTTDSMDFVANTIGAFAGLGLFRFVYGKSTTY